MRTYALALLAAALLTGCGAGTRPATQDEVEGDLWDSLPRGWSALEAPPFARANAVSVWTGRALFYWGGNTNYDETQHAGGALYDPRARIWRRIPNGPLGGRSWAGATWTGKEVFIWGGWRYGPAELADGALFDPTGGTWRMLPPSPLSPRAPIAVVWTGREVLVWGDANTPAGSHHREGAAYDPSTGSWQMLPDAPRGINLGHGIWTGKELIVFGALLDGNNFSATENAIGMAYDPEAGSWRLIAPSPLSPQASGVAWTGKEMLAFDYELEAGAYDPTDDRWRKVGRVPFRFYECYPEGVVAGELIVAWFCGSGATYDISGGGWRRMASTPQPDEMYGPSVYGAPVSAGEVVLFPGAAEDGSRNHLWAYRP